MNVSETKSEGLLREYQIVITAAEIDAEVSKKLEEIAGMTLRPIDDLAQFVEDLFGSR